MFPGDFSQNKAEGIDIRPLIHAPGKQAKLLRRSIADCSGEMITNHCAFVIANAFRDAEINNDSLFDIAIRQHYVFRRDVPMGDTDIMRSGKTGRKPRAQLHHAFRRQGGAAGISGHQLAIDEIHDDEQTLPVVTQNIAIMNNGLVTYF